MSTNSDARDIIEAVQTLSTPTEIDPSRHYVMPVAGEGSVHTISPADERFLAAPRRVRGTTVAYDVDALRALWEKHSDTGSDLFGDPVGFKFTAILNGDLSGTEAGFRDHRVEMPLRVTPAWKAWKAIDGQMLSQVDFAEFIEARLNDVARPTGAEMLELATTLEAKSSVEFKSAVSLTSGARQFTFAETQQARAGEQGQIEIPKDIEIGIAPFEGGDPFKVTARFRHRIRNGVLSLGVVLDRPEDVEKAAFDDFAEKVGQACAQEVLLGTPPAPTLQVR